MLRTSAQMSNGSSNSWKNGIRDDENEADLESGSLLGSNFKVDLSSFSMESLSSGFYDFQDSLSSQVQDISSSLPQLQIDMGPLGSEYRTRILKAVYLLIGAIFFAVMAVLVGLPTLIVRPSKFVLCTSASTLLTIASIVILKTPSVFIRDMFDFQSNQSLPLFLLLGSSLFTAYTTIFIHKYIYVIAAGVMQVLSILFFLASYLPGGRQGLLFVLKAIVLVLRTISTPVIFCLKKTLVMLYNKITS